MALSITTLRAVSALVRFVPYPVLVRVAERGGRALARLRPEVAAGLAANLEPVVGADAAPAVAAAGIGNYARYWAETLLLPSLSEAAVDRRFGFTNYHHIVDSQAAGFGPILVLPHLGQWEWAASWLGRVDHSPVAAVVETLEPPEVFEWFADLRRSYLVDVVPMGGDSMAQLVAAVRKRQIVCLLADRDLQNSGVEVEFFGTPTPMPTGPALLSCRTGAPLLPTAVYHRGDRVHCMVGDPHWPTSVGRLRERVQRMTQKWASDLEDLIRDGPEQWHVVSPLWGEA